MYLLGSIVRETYDVSWLRTDVWFRRDNLAVDGGQVVNYAQK